MNNPINTPKQALVQFDCSGQAVGKMRNELSIMMTRPMAEGPYEMATDEGPFHGGEGTAPPPLALFIGGLTGCIMTQIRAFAKRMDVTLTGLDVEARALWDWEAKGRIYETAPIGLEIDIFIDSTDPDVAVVALIEAAKKGCFIEQTLSQANTIQHRMKTADGWVEV